MVLRDASASKKDKPRTRYPKVTNIEPEKNHEENTSKDKLPS